MNTVLEVVLNVLLAFGVGAGVVASMKFYGIDEYRRLALVQLGALLFMVTFGAIYAIGSAFVGEWIVPPTWQWAFVAVAIGSFAYAAVRRHTRLPSKDRT